ncbi:MAG: excinuclease subunit [Thermacetogenium sp.]|nr:excinuclease subunit [Thermacetogenium sp.]
MGASLDINAELKKELDHLPDRPGVYIFRNRGGRPIYVGKAVSLPNRLRSYFQARGIPERIRRMVEEAERLEYIVTDTEAEALVLECNLIKRYRPKYNVDLKDDKSYPYIRVTAEEFPRVMKTRSLVQDGSRYFGPYPDVGAVKETLNSLRRLFPFRSCPDRRPAPRSRPCLYGQIGQCLAPCTGGVSPEKYGDMIEQLVLFLEGRTHEVERRLRQQMKQAAERLDFEEAARYRNRLEAVNKLREQQRVARATGPDQDILAVGAYLEEVCVVVLRARGGKVVSQEHYFVTGADGLPPGEVLASFIKRYYQGGREIPKAVLVSSPLPEGELLAGWLGEKRGSKVEVRFPRRGRGKDLVELALENAALKAEQRYRCSLKSQEKGRALVLALQEALHLNRPPRRLECIDISHFGGKEAVGSLVCFSDGQPDKQGYRRYRLKASKEGDDYAAVREVVLRRVKNAGKDGLPDLLVIDGGRGQLNAALEALRDSGSPGVSVVSLAKEEEGIYLPGYQSPILLPRNHQGLHLLQQARDEAHRFANSYRERLSRRKVKASLLEQVAGIGKKRQDALIRRFGSLARMREATLEELAEVPGMNRKAAEALYEFLHQPEAQ